MDSKLFNSWRQTVPQLGPILQQLQEKTLIAIGIAPYPRIIPALFLDNYQIYCVRKSKEIDLLRSYVKIFCLEERDAKLAVKVQATSYLLGSYVFQNFLKSRRGSFRLLFHQTTPPIIKKLEEYKLDWIGNRPETFEDVHTKGPFRNILKTRKLPHLEDWYIPQIDISNTSFDDLYKKWDRPVVIQRADLEVGGSQGTFFIRNKEDWDTAQSILTKDTNFEKIIASPLVEGHSTSMLGCITDQGVLTGALQLQLIDVPEALHGALRTGAFLGHDWGFIDWDIDTEKTAQKVTESIGQFLAEKGYQGIFGIDFIYDTATKEIFPLECNPRPPGALPLFSVMTMHIGKVPPLEFFHLMAHCSIKESFNFDEVNEKLKERYTLSYIALSPKNIFEMKIPLEVGIYTSSSTGELQYERPGAFPWELNSQSEFIVIDSIPQVGALVAQNVPRLFKLIFPHIIAQSSHTLEPHSAQLVTTLSNKLLENQGPPPKAT